MGQIALWGAITSFALAGFMLLLTILGAAHLRRVSPEAELFADPTKTSVETPVAVH
jgi:hypothetical protein